MRRLLGAAALVAAILAVGDAAAWGPDGHRVTGEIAWGLLTQRSKDAILEILPEGRGGTLAEAAAWADTEARDQPAYRWLAPLHFVNVDPAARSVTAGRDCRCVIAAIEDARDRLGDPRRSRAERLLALRLVAHFVGDVHQPLHVSHPDGRGGTTIDVRFDGDATTLHRVWDGDLLRRRLREMGARRAGRWRAFAHALADASGSSQRRQWRETRDPRRWAEESMQLARAHAFGVREGARLGDAYYGESMPIVAERLAQAGVRLAAELDAILGAIH